MTTYIEPFLGGGAVALSLLPESQSPKPSPKPFLRWPGSKRKLAADVVSMSGIVDKPDHLILADINAPLITAKGDEHTPNFVLQADFGLDMLGGDEYRSRVCTRVFGRSPLELARMLAGLDEELSTMMRQREAN